jgi:hypothetical protein
MEPAITINGTPLTVAQAMTVRVALGIFLIDLQSPDMDIGPMEIAYRERISEIHKLMR